LTTKERRKNSTEGVTFRIPSDLLDRLRNESKDKRISLNTLANQVFKEHVQFHSFAAQARLYYITTALGSRLVNGLTEDQLSKIAEETAKKDVVDLVLLIKGEFTLPAFLNVLETWLTVGGPTSFKHTAENDVHTFVITHDS
jgi:hypothetical protein